MNAQQLKNAILQEAIEGRLVPQDPNDEPASILLERIRAEKARLVKEGKLKKKDLEVKPISEDEIPFEIPDSWEWCRLGDVTEIARGGSPRPIKEYLTDDTNGLNWIKIGDTDKGGKYINSCKEKIKPEGLKKTRMVHPGDFLLTNSMSFGRPYITNIEGCIHDGWLMISPYAGVFDQSFLFYVLSSAFAHKQFSGKVAGAVVQNLNSDKVADSFVPLPPLAEQKRIVEKIEELLPKVEKYGKAQDELNKLNEELPERLKKSILQEAIEGRLVPQDPNDEPASDLLAKIRKEKEQLVKEGKLKKKDLEVKTISEDEIPFEIPESWEWVRVKSIANKIVDGDHNPPKGLSSDSGYYMLSSKNINNNGIVEFDGVRYLTYEDWKKCNERTNLQKGDVLLTTVGTLGRSCVYESDKPYCFQRSVSVIQSFIFNYYLKYCFDSPFFQSFIDDKATGTAQRGFYLNQLENAIIPIPPLAEQHRIVEKLEQVLGEIDKLKK
jgi:type I restriction enzyme S subunit